MYPNEVKKLVDTAVKSLYGLEVEFDVEYPAAEFGDFAVNAAFKLASRLKQAPGEIAANLARHIKGDRIESAESTGGYINLKLRPETWAKMLEKIDKKYGSSQVGAGQKVQVEFISANPTGPLTLANARGGYLGDVLANVLEVAGYQVTREYYINDAGNQVNELSKSVLGEGRQYQGEYIQELATQLKERSNSTNHVVELVLGKYIKPALTKMGIEFDEWFSEKSLIESGQQQKALERLEEAGLTYEKEKSIWLASSRYGDSRDRVLVKTDGEATYLANDIAYHLNVFESRKFDRAIKLWGADHAGQMPSLKLTMKRLLPDKNLDFIILQMVRLTSGGSEVKISKRAGTYVTVDELITEVGSDVARFFFLMRSPDSHMDFDLDLAKEESQKNPYYYVMYSYARANSILEQAAKRGLKPESGMTQVNEAERELIRQITKLPALINQIVADYEVHHLTFFGTELARIFHDYYESERIIDLEPKLAKEKLYLIQLYLKFMENYWGLLGIKPVPKMQPKE